MLAQLNRRVWDNKGAAIGGALHWSLPCAVIGGAFLVLYLPAFFQLYAGVIDLDRLAHIPVIFAISCWLFWARSREVALPAEVSSWGWPLLALAMSLYIVGYMQGLSFLTIGSLIPALMSVILLFLGRHWLQKLWFPLFFMAFMIPWPEAIVDAITMPVKLAVSYVTEHILGSLGYPIAVSGVVITIAQYQLLVADACSGLQTLFSLEALGVLYLSLIKSKSIFRNVALAILIIPISFLANVMRVIILTLVTYHYGDRAGQGFLHNFSGMAMFFCALLLMMGTDFVLEKHGRTAKRAGIQ